MSKSIFICIEGVKINLEEVKYLGEAFNCLYIIGEEALVFPVGHERAKEIEKQLGTADKRQRLKAFIDS